MMEESLFRSVLSSESARIDQVRELASSLHDKVGQNYGPDLPYSFHLQMVVDIVEQYGHLVCSDVDDVLPLVFGAYFHDTIEDTRNTYNDILRMAQQNIGMTESQAFMAAEIVYALTDEKGRNRAERQSEKYYQGIRETPYAPFVKMADRLANMTFSFSGTDNLNLRMREVYRAEFPEFLSHISRATKSSNLSVPSVMVRQINDLLG